MFAQCTNVEHRAAKTYVIEIASASSKELLGTIRWYGPWRQYCFYPINSLFNHGCLDVIARYLKYLNSRLPWDLFDADKAAGSR
jgi:hypothetical protein